MQYKIAICDDETSFLKMCAKAASEILLRHNINCKISTFDDGTELVNHYKNDLCPFDIICRFVNDMLHRRLKNHEGQF